MVTTETFLVGAFVGRRSNDRSSLRLFYIELDLIFPDRKSRNKWLKTPLPRLGGKTPITALSQGQAATLRHILNTELGYIRDL